VLLGIYLLIGLFAAAPDTTVPGIPVEAALRLIHPAINQGSMGRSAVLLAMINRARAEAGLKALQWDHRLADAANEHAQLMSSKGELSHQFPGEPDLASRLLPKLRLDQAGENVFYDASLESAHEAFMNSRDHRANLLNPAYDSVGIGIIELGGVLYIVEDFAHRVPELSNEDAADRVAQQFAGLRQTAGSGGLRFRHDARVQQLACSMAEHESVDGRAGIGLPGVRVAAFYATTDLAQLPANVARLSELNGVGQFGVGVCYARTPKYPTGLYWVSILLFQS
jgi:uncharacterized protein YkwD